MKILITNDDGIYADGIKALVKSLLAYKHEVIISAPDRERSAAGHSITIKEPLRAKKISLNINELISYKINGTPADCVKLGLEKLTIFEPDLIISGINFGANLGYDVLYSGTVSAALEGYMMGYTSIAVSLAVKNKQNFDSAAIFIAKILNKLEKKLTKEKMLLNINIPDLPKGKTTEVLITTLGKGQYEDTFEERIDPAGDRYYWLTGAIRENVDPGTDIWAIRNNKISITPLKLEFTDIYQINNLKKILL